MLSPQASRSGGIGYIMSGCILVPIPPSASSAPDRVLLPRRSLPLSQPWVESVPSGQETPAPLFL